MRPDSQAASAAAAGGQRRRVRIFVALHLGAVGAIYAAALIVGGGFAGPPMAPLTAASASTHRDAPRPTSHAQPVAATPSDAAAWPAWMTRADVAAPWAPRPGTTPGIDP